MKTKVVFLMISLAMVQAGCKKDVFELPEALVTSKTNLTALFDDINQKIVLANAYIGSVNLDTALIRSKLVELVNGSMDITDFAWISSSGIIQLIEPSLYYGSQGFDISQQAHVIKAFETKLPVLSESFISVEGFYANVVLHPLVKSNSVSGALSGLFYPEQMLENLMKPLFEGKGFEMWVMEKGGRILYDQDAMEIGRNLFTDSLYTDFPELLTAGHQIDEGESGITSYSFYKGGTTEVVTKDTYWTTYTLYGTEWKLVWVKAR
ncbi:MAG: hypothetical protein WC699_02805 [Bacteroidales bacterium]